MTSTNETTTRDQLAAIGAEALTQRDRLLFTLGTMLGYFPSPDDLPDGQPDTPSRLVPVRRLREWWTVIHTLKSIDAAPLAAVLAATTPGQPARVSDLPCVKCGAADVSVRYCDGCGSRRYGAKCQHRDPEHFHRTCRRCGYGWLTYDANDARVVCGDH